MLDTQEQNSSSLGHLLKLTLNSMQELAMVTQGRIQFVSRIRESSKQLSKRHYIAISAHCETYVNRIENVLLFAE